LYFFTAWQRASERDIQMLIDTMVARGVWYEPTRLNSYYWEHQDQYDVGALSPLHPWRTRDQSRPTDAELRDAVLKSEAAEARFITRFYEAGGIILAGTDEVPFPPFGVAEEMRLLVAAGLPPLAALQAATINAARAMGYDDRVGTLEVGKLADIVLLDADPLKDITNVHKIRAVVHDGRLLDRATLDEFLRRVGTP
jgi:imidazolonepropionase-like amidohydrolase